MRARSLCGACYVASQRDGTLHAYPRRRLVRPQVAPDMATRIHSGQSTRAVAQRYQTSPKAVRAALASQTQPIRDLRGGLIGVRSARAVALLLGVRQAVVRRWIRSKLLHARRDRSVQARHAGLPFLVADGDLVTALERRDLWPWLDLAAIADPDWRTLVESAQTTAGGRWWSLRALAAALHYHPETLRQRLPAWPGEKVLISKMWWVWGVGDQPPTLEPPQPRPAPDEPHGGGG